MSSFKLNLYMKYTYKADHRMCNECEDYLYRTACRTADGSIAAERAVIPPLLQFSEQQCKYVVSIQRVKTGDVNFQTC
jgi:uncharacterized protein YlaI